MTTGERAEVARLTRELSDARAALLRGDRSTQDDMKWLLEERDALRACVTKLVGALREVEARCELGRLEHEVREALAAAKKLLG